MAKKFMKRIVALFMIALININTYAAVSGNDGSAYITKAEFDAAVNAFNEQMDNYEASIVSKVDGAIANYLAGLSSERTIPIILPGYTWMKSYGDDAKVVELGIDTTDVRDSKDGNDMYKQGKLYTYYPKYYFKGVLTMCVAYSEAAVYQQEVYVGHIIDGQAYRAEANDSLSAAGISSRNADTAVTEDKLISINPNIYYTTGGKDYVNKVYKALRVDDNENVMGTNPPSTNWVYGGWLWTLFSNPTSSYDLYANNDSGVVSTTTFTGYQYQARCVGTNGGSSQSGASYIGDIIYARSGVGGFLYNNTVNANNTRSYSRAVNVTEQKNEIVPRFKKLADSVADVNTNKIMAVENKKDHYNNKKYYINKRTQVNTLSQKIWYAVGNTSLGTDSSYLPLKGGNGYFVYAYEANSVRKKATELYDYFLKENYDIDSQLTDRVMVYKNTEGAKGRLTFYIVPTSSFVLTLSKDQTYETTDDNLYTFKYSGGTGSSSGTVKRLTVVHTAYSESNPLQLEVEVDNKDYVWLGGESVNNGYITFKFLENASMFISE